MTTALLASIVAVPGAVASAQPFELIEISARPSERVVTVYVSTAGPPPADVLDARAWKLTVSQGKDSRWLEWSEDATKNALAALRYDQSTEQVEIDVPTSAVSGITVGVAKWQAVFFSGGTIYLTTRAETKPAARLKTAKNKDDADLYVLGAVLAGPETKPIWLLDAKGGIGWDSRGVFTRRSIGGTLQINPGAKPPANSSDVNPDAATAFAQLERFGAFASTTTAAQAASPISGVFAGYQLVLRPIGGEFSVETPSGNVTSSGQIVLGSKPARGSLVVDPAIGYELGYNFARPETLFGRPVDFKDYKTIARMLVGGSAKYYVFQDKVKANDVYRLVASASWQARLVARDEPFVKSRYLTNAKGEPVREKVLEMNRAIRHFIEAGLTWNVSPLVGVDMKYRRGSLPPLFTYVDPQITIGMTFKAKLGPSIAR